MKLKHSYGQYFTKEELCNLSLSLTLKHVTKHGRFLEPSYGDGQFIRSLKKINSNFIIDAYEIDPEIFKPIEGVNCFLEDFLFKEINTKYSLIVGNPPYIELVYSFYNKDQINVFKKKYGKKNRGRLNLVHAFFDKSFYLIEDDGVISFLLPSTFLTSPWYNDIREKIYNDFEIMEFIPDVNFSGVSMKVSLLVIKKTKPKTHNFFEKKGNGIYHIVNSVINKPNGKTLKELGYIVGVGQYCWSHHTEKLNNNGQGYKLLYSSYITENGIVEIDNRNKNKKSYLDIDNPKIIDNLVVLPRTISKKIKFNYIKNNQYLLENHTVYITHGDISKLDELYQFFLENKNVLSQLFNSATLTKTEVENIVVNENNYK